MFQSRKKLTGGIFPNGKKISRLLSAKQPADLFSVRFRFTCDKADWS